MIDLQVNKSKSVFYLMRNLFRNYSRINVFWSDSL